MNSGDYEFTNNVLVVSVKNSQNRITAKAYTWPHDSEFFVLIARTTGEIVAYIEDNE